MKAQGVVYLLTAGAAALGSWCLCRWAEHVPIVDVPNDRSSHDRPKPRSGGIGIFLAWCVGVWAASAAGLLPAAASGHWVCAAVGAAAFFLVGLADDLFKLPARVRLALQLVLTTFVAVAGPALRTLDLPGLAPIPLSRAAAVPLTVFWYTGFINAFNFMDGTDGIAAGEAVLAGATLALLHGTALPLLASAAALGFLATNYPPARLFMGDSGSYALGFLLAVSAVEAAAAPNGVVPFWVSVMVLGTFVVDTTVTLVRRWAAGEPCLRAHRSHYYQKLTDLGFSHAEVFWINAVLTLGLCVSGLAYASVGAAGQVILVACWLAAFGAGIRWIHARQGARLPEPPRARRAGGEPSEVS